MAANILNVSYQNTIRLLIGCLCTKLSQFPTMINDEDQRILETFVTTMYDRSSASTGVNAARLDLFARKQRPYEAIPPILAALVYHTKRAIYQASCICDQSTFHQMEIESPADCGWEKQGDYWQVIWTTLPAITNSCQQLTKCGCDCHGRCKCYRSGLPCTALGSCTYDN